MSDASSSLIDAWIDFEETCLAGVPPEHVAEIRTAFFVGAAFGAARGARAARSGDRREVLRICAELLAGGGTVEHAEDFAESVLEVPGRRLDS